MSTRRAFLAQAAGAGALACAAALPRARAASNPFGGALVVPPSQWAHPIEAPPSIELRAIAIDAPKLEGKTGVVVVAIPRDLAPGEKRPLVVLLGGGQHAKEPPEHGAWGWWSDFHLAEIETALRRGRLTAEDLRTGVDEATIAKMNDELAARPHRGCIVATPWLLGRQTDLRPHGAKNLPFLRAVTERLLRELPVLGTRETTGLGGVSVGGMWALHLGPQLSDLFGAIVAVQPFTHEIERVLKKSILGRKQSQRMRIVAAKSDFLHDKNAAFVKELEKAKVEVEYADYPGKHDADFAGGAGGIDMMMAFDRMVWPATAATAASAPASGSSGVTGLARARDMEPAVAGSGSASASGSPSTGASGLAGARADESSTRLGTSRWRTLALAAGGAVLAGAGVVALRARRRGA